MSSPQTQTEDIFRELGPLALGSWMRRVSELLFAHVEEVYKARNIKLKPSLFPCFAAIAQTGKISITEIAERIGVSHAAVHKMAKELLAEKLLLEKRDPEDERRRLLTLSKKGERLLNEISPVWAELKSAVESVLAGEASKFTAQLERIEKNLKEQSMLERVEQQADALPAAKQQNKKSKQSVSIVSYLPKYREDFFRLNAEWIEHYFELEEKDVQILKNPEKSILQGGGEIFFALITDESGEQRAIGTAAMIPGRDAEGLKFELTKMAVLPEARGLGIGKRLMDAAIDFARRKVARSVWLESNSKLETAVGMYEKYGFEHIPLKEDSAYARADVHMELSLDPSS